jgi:hypothetical protein
MTGEEEEVGRGQNLRQEAEVGSIIKNRIDKLGQRRGIAG